MSEPVVTKRKYDEALAALSRLEAERDEEKTLLRFLEEGQPDPFDGELTERADYFIRLARDENAEWQRERDRAEAAEDRVRLLERERDEAVAACLANAATIENEGQRMSKLIVAAEDRSRLQAEALSAIEPLIDRQFATIQDDDLLEWGEKVAALNAALDIARAALAGSVDTTPEPEGADVNDTDLGGDRVAVSKASGRESLIGARSVEIMEHWTCRYCGSTMALAITPGSRHPEEGVWACPACLRAECASCSRDATRHVWGWVNDGGNYRVESLLCGPHAAGQKRRIWGGLTQSEPIAAFFARCGWRSPVWLRKHATLDGHVSYVEFREDWLNGVYQSGCTCSGRCCRGHDSPLAAGADSLHHLAIVREVAHV